MIPTHDGSDVLPSCLGALLADPGDDLAVVVVDDASTSTDALAGVPDDARVRVVRLSANVGFAAAVNAGIEALPGTRAVLVCNDDAICPPATLRALVAHLDDRPDLGATTPLVVAVDRGASTVPATGGRVDTAGMTETWYGRVVDAAQGEPAGAHAGPPRPVLGASAACALYRTVALASVTGPHGTFDERFGMYKEDVDLAHRLRAAGWGASVVPHVRAGHARTASAVDRASISVGTRRRSLWNDWRILARPYRPLGRRIVTAAYLVAKSAAVLAGR